MSEGPLPPRAHGRRHTEWQSEDIDLGAYVAPGEQVRAQSRLLTNSRQNGTVHSLFDDLDQIVNVVKHHKSVHLHD